MFLFQINSFQFRCIRSRPCNICIIQIGMNIREIHGFKRIFIEKLEFLKGPKRKKDQSQLCAFLPSILDKFKKSIIHYNSRSLIYNIYVQW